MCRLCLPACHHCTDAKCTRPQPGNLLLATRVPKKACQGSSRGLPLFQRGPTRAPTCAYKGSKKGLPGVQQGRTRVPTRGPTGAYLGSKEGLPGVNNSLPGVISGAQQHAGGHHNMFPCCLHSLIEAKSLILLMITAKSEQHESHIPTSAHHTPSDAH